MHKWLPRCQQPRQTKLRTRNLPSLAVTKQVHKPPVQKICPTQTQVAMRELWITRHPCPSPTMPTPRWAPSLRDSHAMGAVLRWNRMEEMGGTFTLEEGDIEEGESMGVEDPHLIINLPASNIKHRLVARKWMHVMSSIEQDDRQSEGERQHTFRSACYL